METQTEALWALIVYSAFVLAVVAGMLGVSFLLGERHKEGATGEAYESGTRATGSARVRLSAHFYLVAMFFVIFDLESVFIFVWAASAREAGWTGYVEILVFIAVLMAALVYLWRSGALDWGTRGARRVPGSRKEGGARHALVAEQN